uniref:Uncharacterized protein n=1 Tax=Amphimedon queenslandica TaxID=400682 RepID=A0A1X7UIT7_AMPQE
SLSLSLLTDPKFVRLVNWAPFQPARLNFSGILIK